MWAFQISLYYVQMGILQESREINASHPLWRMFEASKEKDQTILMSVFSKMSLDFALNICDENM